MALVRKALFWFQVAITVLILLLGVAFTGRVLFENGFNLIGIFSFGDYFISAIGIGLELLVKAPEISIPCIGVFSVFQVCLALTPHTNLEKRVARFALLLFPIGLLLTTAGIFAVAIGSLPT